MSVVSLSGSPVIAGSLDLPLVGTWHLECAIGSSTAPVVGQRVTLLVGPVPFVGTVVSADSDSGNRVTVRAVGGAGKLGNVLTAKSYTMTSLDVVLVDALTEAGESRSILSDSQTETLEHWTRTEASLSDVLRQVTERVECSWRVLPDGSVWVGAELWLPVTGSYVLESEEPTRSAFTVAVDSAWVLPGVTFRGRKVSAVTYRFDGTKTRARVSYGDARGELGSVLGELVRREVRQVDLLAMYSATVDVMNADGTVELTPDDSRLGSMSRVPVQLGGLASVGLLPGTSVILTHENGDPSKPVVVQAYSGAVNGLSVESLGEVAITAPQVKAGGELPLVLHDPLLAWVSALTSAAAPLGLAVPPLLGCSTNITRGA